MQHPKHAFQTAAFCAVAELTFFAVKNAAFALKFRVHHWALGGKDRSRLCTSGKYCFKMLWRKV